jgi:hypothetical protein
MARTRSLPGPHRRAALGRFLRFGVAVAAAVALLAYRSRLERIATDNEVDAELQDTAFTIALAVLAAFALFQLAVAVWRTSRWLVARRYERMLQDPRRAAEVPPLETHLTELRRDPLPLRAAGMSLGLATLLIGGVVLVLWSPGSEQSTTDDPDIGQTVLIALLGLGLLVWTGYSLRRWRRARRAERMSADPALGTGTPPEPAARRADVIPELTVSVSRGARAILEPLQPVGRDRNVFGRPPWDLAYLRLFDNEATVKEFLHGPWRACGYVHLIRSALSVSHAELEAAEQGASPFISDQDWLERHLDSQPIEPDPAGRRELVGITSTKVKVTDPYGSYPVRALLCHESFWKAALDVLLQRVDVVVLDLSGYLRANVGTGYELQRMVDRFPVDRCVLLADDESDAQFLEAQVREAWSRMAYGSPNAGTAAHRILIANGPQSWGLAMTMQTRLDDVNVG